MSTLGKIAYEGIGGKLAIWGTPFQDEQEEMADMRPSVQNTFIFTMNIYGHIILIDSMPDGETNSFILTLKGKTPDGRYITPENTRIDDLFNQLQDVRKLVQDGSALISFEEGSLKTMIVGGATVIAALVSDIQNIQRGNYYNVNSKRITAVESLMNQARKNNWEYDFSTPDSGSLLVISRENPLPPIKDVWIPSLSVFEGEITDAGGKDKPNIHLLSNGKILKINATKEQLGSIEENMLYKNKRIKVSYLLNPRTGDMKEYKLLAILEQPTLDTDKLNQFIEQGTKDWADVKDITAWVEDHRKGGEA